MIRLFLGSFAFCVFGFGLFAVAVEHPYTKGLARCWLQEAFYAQEWAEPPVDTPIVDAVTSTEAVQDLCDAADDPAIVAREGDFLVLGTNKQGSINVYDQDGRQVSRSEGLGAPNNVDVRLWKGRRLVFASEKDDGQVLGFVLNEQGGALETLPGFPVSVEKEEEVYGLCLYDAGNALFAFTTDKSGLIVQHRIETGGERSSLSSIRTLRVHTQPEGCAVDDANGVLFVGEEDFGIWRFDADPRGGELGTLVASTDLDGQLVPDVEGLAIYACSAGPDGFLIASSQGDNSYAIFDRASPHAFRGKFQIRNDGAIVGDTDGLEVSSKPLGLAFPKGILVVQDGFIRDSKGERRNQRFTYVSWSTIETALGISDPC